MSVSPHRKKLTSGRKLQLEQLESRRVFAGLVLDTVITTESFYPNGKAYGYYAAIDSSGNKYSTGIFEGTADFDRENAYPDNRDMLTVANSEVRDSFVAKYDPQGQLLWVKQFSNPSAPSITLDSHDAPIISGSFQSQLILGGNELNGAGNADPFIAKLTQNGDVLWAKSWGSELVESNLNVVTDGQDNISAVVTSSEGDLRRIDLRQFAPDGTQRWTSDFGQGDVLVTQEMVVDSEGSLYLSSRFLGTVDIDPSASETLITGSAEDRNFVISKISSEGVLRWATVFRTDSVANVSTLSNQSPELAIGNDGSLVFLNGYQGNTAIVSDSEVTDLPFSSDNRTVFGKLDTSNGGLLQSVFQNGWLTNVSGGFVAIDGGYAATGYTGASGFTYLDGLNVASMGSNDVWLVTFSEEGIANWAGLVGGSSIDYVVSVASDQDGGVLLSGFSSSATFDFEPTAYVGRAVDRVGSYLLQLKPRKAGTQIALFEHDFESTNWSTHWVQGSQFDWFRSTQRSTLGGYSAEVDGSANNATLTTANVVDLTGLDSAELTFDWLIESGFDAGEYLSLDVSTDGGTSWTQDVRRLSGNVSAENVWHSEVVDMTPYMTANTKIRFRSKVSASDEDANVDNVRITGIVAGPNSAPVADAGSGYAMNEGSSVMLSGLESFDPDGTIASYAWDLDGDGQYDDANGVTAIFTTIVSGSHTVGLQVTDNRGATATATAIVSVNNVAPTADAGNDQSLTLGNAASLSASGSTDPGLDIVDYLWDLDNDGLFGDASGVSANFTPAATGSYTIRVQVTDADGATSVDQMQLVVTDVPAETTLFEDSFEVAEWNGLWVEDSQNDWFRSTQRATHGTRSAEVDGLANNATLTMASGVNLSGYASATLTFDWLIESGFDAGEFLSLDISTNGGATWIQDVRRLNGDVSTEDVWHNESVDLSSYASSNLKIRFRSSVSSSTEDANVDNVKIVASNSGNGLLAAMSASSLDAYFADLVKKRKA